MLPITVRMSRTGREISEAIGYLKDVRTILMLANKEDAYLRDLEPYVDYTLPYERCVELKDDVLVLSYIIGQVYYGQMSINEASKKVDEAIKQLLIVRSGIIKMEYEAENCRD